MVPAKKVVAKTATTKSASKAVKEVQNTETIPTRVRSASKPATPTADERNQMIAEAAYYRALGRGFQNGTEESDWLAAEQEIDSLIATKTDKKTR